MDMVWEGREEEGYRGPVMSLAWTWRWHKAPKNLCCAMYGFQLWRGFNELDLPEKATRLLRCVSEHSALWPRGPTCITVLPPVCMNGDMPGQLLEYMPLSP
jgi:hypothetical protein